MNEQDQPLADPAVPAAQPRTPWWQDRFKLAVTVSAVLAGVVAAVLLVVFLMGSDSNAGVADGPSSPTASASGSPSNGPSLQASPTATPQATATEKPSRPRTGRAALKPGWAYATGALNLRTDPGTDTTVQSRILEGEVLRIIAGPEARDGYDWYFAQTLTYNQGWVASGPASDPFVAILGPGATFATCGPVTSGGKRVDGLRIGPSDEVFNSMLELAAATDGEACVTFLSRDNNPPWRHVSFDLEACGRPVFGPAGYFGFKPTTAGDVADESRLQRRVDIPNAFFQEGSTYDEDEYTNKWAVFLVAKNGAEPLACVSANINENPEAYQRDLAAHLTDCISVAAEDSEFLTIKPATGTSTFWFREPPNTSIDPVTAGEPRLMTLVAESRQWKGYLTLTDEGSC